MVKFIPKWEFPSAPTPQRPGPPLVNFILHSPVPARISGLKLRNHPLSSYLEMGINSILCLSLSILPNITKHRQENHCCDPPDAPFCWPEARGLVGLLLRRWLAGLTRHPCNLVICKEQKRGDAFRNRKNYLFSGVSFPQGFSSFPGPKEN